MTKKIEYREDSFETIREGIKGKKALKAIIDDCVETYPDVHPQTFRKWYKKVKKEDDINTIMKLRSECLSHLKHII